MTIPKSFPSAKLIKQSAINPATVVTELPTTDENIFISAACKDGNVDKGIQFLLGKGTVSVNKVKAENVIVLLSDFDVDNSGNNPVLNPGETYTNYNWILIRDDKNSDWKVDDCGF